jgi:hypothetical protein
MQWTDKRVGSMNEIITGISMIKVYFELLACVPTMVLGAVLQWLLLCGSACRTLVVLVLAMLGIALSTVGQFCLFLL